MKFFKFIFLFFVLLLFFSPLAASAHPGNTDANGGHYDRSTGEYHYHHGYPAHQHIDGKCPYDFEDKTGQNSGNKGSSKSGSATEDAVKSDKAMESKGNWPDFEWWITIAPLLLTLNYWICGSAFDSENDKQIVIGCAISAVLSVGMVIATARWGIWPELYLLLLIPKSVSKYYNVSFWQWISGNYWFIYPLLALILSLIIFGLPHLSDS